MNIQIFGQDELITHIENGGKTYSHCISITNPGRASHSDDTSHATPELIKNHFQTLLELEFWDSENLESFALYENQKLADQSDIDKVLKFALDNQEAASGFTLHCWRGISRSPAIAYGLLYTHYKDEIKAAENLISIRRQAMPLKRILQLFDQRFNTQLACLDQTVYRARMKAMRRELGI